jgi:hypothetical protein
MIALSRRTGSLLGGFRTSPQPPGVCNPAERGLGREAARAAFPHPQSLRSNPPPETSLIQKLLPDGSDAVASGLCQFNGANDQTEDRFRRHTSRLRTTSEISRLCRTRARRSRRLECERFHNASTRRVETCSSVAAMADIPLPKRPPEDAPGRTRTCDPLLRTREPVLRSTAACRSACATSDGPHIAAAVYCGLPLPQLPQRPTRDRLAAAA